MPSLSALSPKLSKLLSNRALAICWEQGDTIFDAGQSTQSFLLVVAGTVRIQRLSQEDGAVLLYRVRAGDSCVLAAEDQGLEGIAETDTQAIIISTEVLNEMMVVSNEFRALIFGAYSNRITDLFSSIEQAMLKPEDIRFSRQTGRMESAGGKLQFIH